MNLFRCAFFRGTLASVLLCISFVTPAISDGPHVQDAEIRSGEKVASTERLKPYELTLGSAAGYYKGEFFFFVCD